jgi:hypothetical protein
MKRSKLITALKALPYNVEVVCDSTTGVFFEPNVYAPVRTLWVIELTNPSDGKTWKQFYSDWRLAERARDCEIAAGLDVIEVHLVDGVKI